MRGQRWVAAAAAVFSVGIAAGSVLWAFGGEQFSAKPPASSTTTAQTATGATTGVGTSTDPNGTNAATTAVPPPPPPQAPPDEPEYATLEEYQRRCERINQRGALAVIVYEARKEMDLGVSETVRAAVTLDQTAPPETVLPGTTAAGESGVVVSCSLQARLSASRYEFDVEENNWVSRSLYTTDTARWVWRVTPKLGGTRTLSLFVRPIVVLRGNTGNPDAALAAESDIREYTTRVHVSVPWNKRPEEVMTQVASLLNVAEGLVQALTVLVIALAGLGAALGYRRRKRRTQNP